MLLENDTVVSVTEGDRVHVVYVEATTGKKLTKTGIVSEPHTGMHGWGFTLTVKGEEYHLIRPFNVDIPTGVHFQSIKILKKATKRR